VYNRGSELVNKDNSTIFFSENCLDETKLVVRDRLDKKSRLLQLRPHLQSTGTSSPTTVTARSS
jgi:hypothetical protein